MVVYITKVYSVFYFMYYEVEGLFTNMKPREVKYVHESFKKIGVL